MFSRIATRVPLTAVFAGKRVATASIRANSSSSTSSAARVMEMAAQAERPSTLFIYPLTLHLRTVHQPRHNKANIHEGNLLTVLTAGAEAAVPVIWAACGVLTYAAWNRMSERSAGENVEKLLIV
jgi:hypothetical protein